VQRRAVKVHAPAVAYHGDLAKGCRPLGDGLRCGARMGRMLPGGSPLVPQIRRQSPQRREQRLRRWRRQRPVRRCDRAQPCQTLQQAEAACERSRRGRSLAGREVGSVQR
jgi:plasmid stabilization system protein ParE